MEVYTALSSILIIIVFFVVILIQSNKIKILRQELHHNPTENAHLQSYVKKLLQQESEIKVIKKLRKEKGMSMLDAKKLIDSINK